MDCRAFRETYTDLLDGLLEEADEVRFREHLAACAACHRFDQAYRLGVSALQGLPCLRSSRDFTARVLHAIRTDPGSRVPSLASGFAGAALVMALIGFLAIDLKALGHRESAVSADFRDAVLAAASPDSGADSVGLRLRDAALIPPFWDQRTITQVRAVDLSSNGALFVVPAAWAGR
jgi:predicted anti-sigma-YlaC factor YlaD